MADDKSMSGKYDGLGKLVCVVDTNLNLRKQVDTLTAELAEARAIILSAPGSDEEDFQARHRKWWGLHFVELRSPGCLLPRKTFAEVKAELADARKEIERLDKAVLRFAHNMQDKLDKNKDKECPKMNKDHKGRSWEHCDYPWLFKRLLDEAEELRCELIELYEAPLEPEVLAAVKNEAADVGNFAMMIHDNANSALNPAPAEGDE